MTITEFNEQAWGVNMFIEYKDKKHEVCSVDFIEKLIGFYDNSTDITWVRCENCKLLENNN